MSRAAKERWAVHTEAERTQISVNMSKAVIKGIANMTLDAKREMYNNISIGIKIGLQKKRL
jgi:hypothetical protein